MERDFYQDVYTIWNQIKITLVQYVPYAHFRNWTLISDPYKSA